MNTTALLVDILIIGVQSLVWIASLIFTFFLNPHPAKQLLNNYPTSFLFIAIVIAYTLGIIVDYLSAIVFGWIKSKDEKELYKDVKIVKIVANDRQSLWAIKNCQRNNIQSALPNSNFLPFYFKI